ncbi:hypothetical protein GGH12_005975 [Coemansia sp. RSA 1822]|nr:hypothetical protein LPJ76_006154 [Coemansia sp. RSA 638]KAJ2118882.1 hypothetical protein IW147_006264 [Coemansia sp. RSA 720]KAJ2476766.1 hypothetical protein IWW56_004735 [Coemansia sp. RSA 2131]KAJ2538299.1 hypothetical protein GGF49_005996 [Coemansia sp. RSA 1853]KAJ2558159.1 hypothetical protein GGH12_005975 [Coemansia sp. RSA 1822]KAJ2654699.1 hypothetical protein IW148_006301 [Coemansia sp. RSA 1199]
MLRTVFARTSVRSVISAPAARVQMRSYSDVFQERENASENMYIHEKEKEQVKLMREKLAKAQKQIDELEEHINKKERESTK